MSEGAKLQPATAIGEDRYLLPVKKIDDRIYSALIDGDGNRKGSFLFRQSGGPANTFQGEYARVIMYDEVEEKEEWVIINRLGYVCLIQSGLNYLYIMGGHLGFATNDGYYDLTNSKKIMGTGYSSMSTEEFLFVEDGMGVHKINKHTLQVEVFPKQMVKPLPEEESGEMRWYEEEPTQYFALEYNNYPYQVTYSEKPHVGGVQIDAFSNDEVPDRVYELAKKKLKQLGKDVE